MSDAGTSLLDSAKGVVAEELLAKLGLGDYIELIPPVLKSDAIVGTLTPQMATELGLKEEIPVVAGAIDVVAAAVGIGVVDVKDVCVILGTTCANEIFLHKSDCDFGKEGTRYEKHAVGDLFMNLLPTMNGTPNLDWVINEIAMTQDFKQIDAMISEVPAGSGGVIYHPYISAAGERAPFYNPHAKAGFFGINAKTNRATLVNAVYEGISFSIKDCLQGVDKNGRVFLAGGGAKSSVWAQMIADVLGMEVVISEGNEFGAKGVAMSAGVAVGEYKDYHDAAERTCKISKSYLPNMENNKVYEALYPLYKEIREVQGDLWNKRAAIMKTIG